MRSVRTFLPTLALACASAAFAADPPPDAPKAPRDRAAMRAVMEACKADSEKFCGTAQPGGGRKVMCLREHGSELAPACRDGLEKVEAARKARQAP